MCQSPIRSARWHDRSASMWRRSVTTNARASSGSRAARQVGSAATAPSTCQSDRRASSARRASTGSSSGSAAHHPELFEWALAIERVALTGRHSRFDAVEFGADWEDLVRNAERFPSSNTRVGLGCSFAWNHWARVNGVVDGDFKVRLVLTDHRKMNDRLPQHRTSRKS